MIRHMNTIKRIRHQLGKSQADFGSIAGVDQSTVSRWEKGDGEPSLSEIQRIIINSNGAIKADDFVVSNDAA